MVQIIEDTARKIRNLPVDAKLIEVLSQACKGLPVEKVLVVSGGQCPKGTCTKRTGSTRHDLGRAADLQLWVDGRVLRFTTAADLPVFSAFITSCAALGAQGFGAGIDYMGPDTIHVGYGGRAVWGGTNPGSSAPDWLRQAAQAGWNKTKVSSPRTYAVVARSGLRLRAGPGSEFEVLSTINAGEVVTVSAFDGSSGDWARVDLQGDGYIDGHLLGAFLQEVDLVNDAWPQPQDDCSADRQAHERATR